MILTVVDRLNSFIEPFKKFVFNNYNNPVMWFGFVLIGIVIFSIVFDMLNKNNY